MWVQLTEDDFLNRDDLMENTHSTLRNIWYLGEVTRILINDQLRPVERPLKKSNSPITVVEEIWSTDADAVATIPEPVGGPKTALPANCEGLPLADTLLQWYLDLEASKDLQPCNHQKFIIEEALPKEITKLSYTYEQCKDRLSRARQPPEEQHRNR